ncbi:Modification methylase Eco47II [Labeo rohita]|uniref:Modification methylase Eco47II n=1 Tax=Labeo rohita TaxID=84645 RepID=A0ABQ8MXD1_LABRO|nr:Modification methylase Eco47II [Labeo rohita]
MALSPVVTTDACTRAIWHSAPERSLDPILREVSHVLTFFQEWLDKGYFPSTLKVYVPAIAVNHSLLVGKSIFLRALEGLPFQPLQMVDLRPMSLKTALLLTLALVKRVSDLQALSVTASCLEYGQLKGLLVTKQRLSRWIVDAIVLTYEVAGRQCPICVRAHSTREDGLFLGVVQYDFHWGDLCGHQLVVAIYLC